MFSRLILIIALFLVLTQSAYSAGTITEQMQTHGNIRVIILTCTADAAAATYPTTEVSAFEGRLIKMVTNPGSPAPTDDYDIVINNQHGTDVLGGRGANRDTANNEEVELWDNEPTGQITITTGDTLSIIISNNSVNSAVTVVTLYYALGF